MRAVTLKEFGGTDNLILTDVPVPSIAKNEVLVKVSSISINPVDIKTRKGTGLAGRLKEQRPLILGWDISGTVTEVASGLTDFKGGDEVFGMVNFPGHGKAYAEFVAVPANQLALKPANISHEEAAAATLAVLTAYQAFTKHTRIKQGDRVLIHAASGGVGHYAVQIAKHLGAYVIGTSSAANKDFVLGLGADEHIDYKTQEFEKATSQIDLVFDAMGGDYIDRSLEVIKPGGTLISIPTGLNEAVKEKAKAKNVNGFFILVESNGEDMKAVAALLAKDIIKSHVSATYPLREIAKAHQQIESGRTRGKITVNL